VHIICRFTNSEFRLRYDSEREEYLRRLGLVAERTDWVFLAYAVMSSHVHLVAVSGERSLDDFIRALNTGMAGWLNKRQERLGHVFAGRPRTVICTDRTAGYVIAYVGNNPRRAGVVSLARESSWTSHRYYLEPSLAPDWLDVTRGLLLAGFTNTASGRRHFDEFVNRLGDLPRNDILNGRAMPRVRRDARQQTGAPLEIASPLVDVEDFEVRATTPLVSSAPVLLRPRARVPVADVVEAVARELEADVAAIRSRSRRRPLPRARRLAMLIWTVHLNEPSIEMAVHLGLSSGGASHLLNRSPEVIRALTSIAERLTALLCGDRPDEEVSS